jgi:hypothetical protein
MSSVLTDLPGRKVMQAQGGATHRKIRILDQANALQPQAIVLRYRGV